MTSDTTNGDAIAARGMNVVAVAGRRIDALDSPNVRFPLNHMSQVRDSICKLFQQRHVQALICSAACGADLLALDVADELALRAVVILPFSAERFRATSVTDRPGNWGPLFDRLVAGARRRDMLLVADPSATDHDGYLRVTEMILQRAVDLSLHTETDAIAAQPGAVMAVVIWDGSPRSPSDLTQHFAASAQKLGIPVCNVST